MRALKGHRDHRIGVIGRARLLARPSLGGSAAPASLVALAFSLVPRSAARPLRRHWSRSPSRSSLARRLGRSGVIGRARLLARPSLGGSAAPASLVALAFSLVPRSAARPLRRHWSRSPSRSSLARRLGRSGVIGRARLLA